jgi:hypothetical protein
MKEIILGNEEQEKEKGEEMAIADCVAVLQVSHRFCSPLHSSVFFW